MNNHQSLRSEIDARAENFSICVNLGKDLLHRRHPRSDEVSLNAYFLLTIARYVSSILDVCSDIWCQEIVTAAALSFTLSCLSIILSFLLCHIYDMLFPAGPETSYFDSCLLISFAVTIFLSFKVK